MRPSKDEWFSEMALLISRRSTCHRLYVGCVLVNARGHVISTGYNGRASGLAHCNDRPVDDVFMDMRVTGSDVAFQRQYIGKQEVFPHRCQNSDAPSGQPNGCEAIHAEQNALLQCRDVYQIQTAYVTHSPCLVCVKLLLNTSCTRIVFAAEYAQPDAKRLWQASEGRQWVYLADLPTS